MQPTDGLVRGAEVTDTGGPIAVPVGETPLGHVWNTLGVPLDVDEKDLDIQTRWGIHRNAPSFDQLESQPRSSRPVSRSSTSSPRTSRAARSACSAAPAWARRF